MAAPLIAVVNDDTAFLDLMTELLGEEGYETVICKESRDVHKLVRTKQPALVILDIRMEHPETGWSILEMLQLDRATTRIPVIVCSADAQFLRSKEEHLRQRGYDTLEKPFNLEDLLQKVEAALGRLPSEDAGTAGTRRE